MAGPLPPQIRNGDAAQLIIEFRHCRIAGIEFGGHAISDSIQKPLEAFCSGFALSIRNDLCRAGDWRYAKVQAYSVARSSSTGFGLGVGTDSSILHVSVRTLRTWNDQRRTVLFQSRYVLL